MLIGRECGSGDTPATKIGSSVSQRRWDLEATKPWFPTEEGFTRSDWCTFTPWGLKAVRFRADPSDSVGKFKGVREKRVRDPLYWKGMYDYLDVWKPHRLLYILYISYIIIINYIYRALDSTIRYSIFMCIYTVYVCIFTNAPTLDAWRTVAEAKVLRALLAPQWLGSQSRKSAGSQ